MKQTKIVASISDRRCDQDFIRKLFFAGMNVVRMNTAHATEEGIRTIVKNVRAVSPHIGIMIDTKGPEVRTTGVKEPIHYNVGDVVKIFGRPEIESSHDIVNVSYPDIAADVKVGDDLLFDDGELDMKTIEFPPLSYRVSSLDCLHICYISFRQRPPYAIGRNGC